MKALLIISFGLLSFGQNQTLGYGNFTFVPMSDPIDDSDKSRIVVTDSENSYDPAYFFWACTGRDIFLFLLANEYIGNDGPTKVTYRFGDFDAVNETWFNTSDGKGLLVPDLQSLNFSKLALQTKQLVVRFSDYQGVVITYIFDLTGFENAIQVLGCNPLKD